MTKLCRIRNCCSRFLATQSLLLFAMVAVAAARTAEVPVGGLQLEPLIETSHSKEISRVTDFVKSFSASTPACAAKYGEMLLTSYLQVLLSTGVRPADIGNYPVCRAIPNTKTCTFPSALGVVAGPIAICAPDVCTPAALVAPQFLQLLKAVSPLAAGTLNSTGYKVEYIQCQVSYEVDGPAAGVLAYLGVFGTYSEPQRCCYRVTAAACGLADQEPWRSSQKSCVCRTLGGRWVLWGVPMQCGYTSSSAQMARADSCVRAET